MCEIMECDIAVFGATPCGISAALAAARFGKSVALIAAGDHIGGLMASGLSITDLRFRGAFGGIFDEFARRVLAYYTNEYGEGSEQARACNGGIWFEPHVAERIFEQMVAAEERIVLLRGRTPVRMEGETAASGARTAVFARSGTGERAKYAAKVWIDGSYEGDLAVAAGVRYRVGREGMRDHHEPYAGVVFLRNPGLQVLDGSTGEGDHRIQAYNFRLCLTNRDDIRVLPEKPAHYRREWYAPLIGLCRSGAIRDFNDVIRLAPIPNGKFNGNNRPIAVSLDLPEANTAYPEASAEVRRRIVRQYREYTMGLLWFLQNEPELPESFRLRAAQWGLCRDEFADNGHLPYELYVREARRIVGRTTFTARDAFLEPGAERAPVQHDSVAVGDYHVDSHIVRKPQPGWPQMEGHVYLRPISKPAQIPYGVMVPQDVEGILVPGALSATHLGFSVLRMEPPWMALGQAAGTAAHLALERGVAPSRVPVPELQHLLLQQGQVIALFYDVSGDDAVWAQLNRPNERTRLDPNFESAPPSSRNSGLQFFGTKPGFFTSYYARPYDPLTRSEAVRWLYRFMELDGTAWSENGVPSDSAWSENGASSVSAPAAFADVTERHPDYVYIAALAGVGMADSWRQTGGFYPNAAVSRMDAIQWVIRMLKRTRSWMLEAALPPIEWPDLDRHRPGHAEFRTLAAHRLLPARWGERAEILPLFYITREEFCELLYYVYFATEAKA